MSGASEFAIVAAGTVWPSRQFRARVEKPSSCNGLRQERQDFAQRSGDCAPCALRRPLSRYETASREPLWNGPPLNAAFAAQLIAQVLDYPAARDSRLALAAYRDRARDPLTILRA